MKFYRFEMFGYSEIASRLELRTYDLIRETPKGYWIGTKNYRLTERWVSKTSKKRFAYPTEQEALVNYIKRTKRRIKILEYQLEDARYGLELAEKKFKKEYQDVSII